MARIRRFLSAWASRRRGQAAVRSTSNLGRAARDIVGPTGFVFSGSFEKLDQHGKDYMKSFDPHIPPSTFVSERDRLRHHQPMPISERCLEDWKDRSPRGASADPGS